MSADEHLNPVQFMTARQIVASHTPNDRLKRDTDDASIWARKLEESRQPSPLGTRPDGTSSVYEGVERQGVGLGSREPVTLQDPGTVTAGETPRVLDGHHRIAALSTLHPDTPVSVQYAANARDMHVKRTASRGKR